jgi:hypothetical protein
LQIIKGQFEVDKTTNYKVTYPEFEEFVDFTRKHYESTTT